MSSRQEAEALLLEQVLQLPRTAELEIPEDYLDANGHVNVMYYTLLGNLGWRNFFDLLGLHREQFKARQRSTFVLNQFISYLHELREGDQVAVHSGLYDFDAKRLHFFYYVVNLSSGRLASVDERLVMYIDMTARRSTAFEPEYLEQLGRVRIEHATVWQPQISGAIHCSGRTAGNLQGERADVS